VSTTKRSSAEGLVASDDGDVVGWWLFDQNDEPVGVIPAECVTIAPERRRGVAERAAKASD
jgi:hypothetical protein